MKYEIGVYKIVNLLNNKVYIGSSLYLSNRKSGHFTKLQKNIHPNQHLQNAWNKYGKEVFRFEIIEYIEGKNKLLEKEQYYIDLFQAFNKKYGYNICPIAGNTEGIKHTDEVKRKMSISRTGSNNSFFNKKHTLENIEKNRITHQGENSSNSKLTKENVLLIYKMIKDNYMINDIAKYFNVKPNTISSIKYGKRWSHLYYLF